MDDILGKLNPQYFEQLAFGLQIDGEQPDAPAEEYISLEEQARRSMMAQTALEKLIGEDSGRMEWFATYLQLRDMRYPWRIACYIAWASSPRRVRWPKTQDEFAREVLGLNSDRVIATWRRKSPEIDEAIALLQAAPLMAHRADVFQALATSAADPDHRSNPDRKLFLELTGDYVPRAKLDVKRSGDIEDLSEMSEDELLKLARRARGAADGE